MKFDKCDERRYAELTLSNLDTQTIAPDVPTQEQRYRFRQRHRHLNHRRLQNGVWKRRPN